MKYFFEDPEKCELLNKEVREWLHTPFKHHAGVKKFGCDCIHFVLRVYESVGAITPGTIRVPTYPKDWHLHNEEELLYNNLKRLPMFEEIEIVEGFPTVEVMDGDIYLHKYGLALAHSSIYSQGCLYHAINEVGVQDTVWYDQKWASKRSCGFRMLAK